MCWLKRVLWKASIAIAVMLLLLMAIAGLPVSAANTAKELAGFAGPGAVTVQVTPTEDATVTALNKEKLALEVQQMKSQTEPDPLSWLQTNAAILISTLVVVIGGLIGLFRWFGDRVSEREKRVVERFQSAVTALGDEKEHPRFIQTIPGEGYCFIASVRAIDEPTASEQLNTSVAPASRSRRPSIAGWTATSRATPCSTRSW